MAQDEIKEPGKFVEAMQRPQAVVTYRAVVGVFVTLIFALVAAIGNDLRETQREIRGQIARTNDTLGSIQISFATMGGRVDEQGERIGRNENAINRQGEKIGALDTRVTVLEHRGAR